VALIREYMAIEGVRFGTRLTTDIDVAPDCEELAVPALVLQPLVENAVKHGVGRQRGVGRIEIGARVDGTRLVLSVRDNGPGMDDAPVREGVGVRNTRERLAQLYGEAGALALRPAEGGGVEAEVSLPYHPAEGPEPAGVASVPAAVGG